LLERVTRQDEPAAKHLHNMPMMREGWDLADKLDTVHNVQRREPSLRCEARRASDRTLSKWSNPMLSWA